MKYYVVDAFTDTPFHGNPAGVCLPDGSLSDETMQSIAFENSPLGLSRRAKFRVAPATAVIPVDIRV